MFKRPHHQTIHKLLGLFNAKLLMDAECYFAGGTAIALLLNEYRESIDVDFLCGSKEGYRVLRNCVTQQSLGDILNEPVKHSSAWKKVIDAYGESVVSAFQKSVLRLSDVTYLKRCFEKMNMDSSLEQSILFALKQQITPIL